MQRGIKKKEKMLREGGKQHFCAHIAYPRCLLTQVFKNQGTELQILPRHGHAVYGVTKSWTRLTD